MDMQSAPKHTCKVLDFCQCVLFLSIFMFILFTLPLHYFFFTVFGGNAKPGQVGTISSWLYFTLFLMEILCIALTAHLH